MPQYTRDGVEASARLASLDEDVSVWQRVEEKYDDMISEKGGEQLLEMDRFCDCLAQKLREMKSPSISKDDLLQVVKWKFAKGKPRHALMKHLKSNSDSDVRECSCASFAQARNDDISAAINAMTRLKGVGPATASALLSLFRPDMFAFADDEVIECLYDGKRGYTAKIYVHVNEKCAALAKNLGEGWTPRRVGRALWTAARIHACGGDDLTLKNTVGTAKRVDKRTVSAVNTNRSQSKPTLQKRRKRNS